MKTLFQVGLGLLGVRLLLTAGMGLGQWLCPKLKRAGLAKETISAERIEASANRMRAMITGLVDSARLQAGSMEMHLEAVDPLPFAVDVTGPVGTPADQGRIQVQTPEWLPQVSADPDRLERVLVNLIANLAPPQADPVPA